MKHYYGLSLLLVVVAIILMAFLEHCENRTQRAVAGIKKTFASVLKIQPEIRINQVVVYSQTAPIAELAVVTKEQWVEYNYIQYQQLFGKQIALTEKKIVARGIFRLKAGFDLKQPFVVFIDDHAHQIRAKLSPAKILSVELKDSIELKDESGWLNSVTTEERQQVLDGLCASARSAAEQSGLVQDAEAQVLDRLQQLSRENGQQIRFNWEKKN